MPSSSSTATANAAETQFMHLTVDRDALMTEVAAAERVADPRGSPPILSHLLLDAKDGVLAITGCDLKRTLRSECPAEVKVSGKAAVSAQKFLSYLKVLPKGRIAVKLLENQHLQVHAGSSRTRMPGRNPADFPAIPEPAADVIRLSSRALKTVLRQTVFAVATTEERYLLNAALLLLRVNRMGMVATDGHRMSLVEMADEEALVEGNTTSKTLLPRECMLDLLSLLGSSKEETVEFSQDEATVYFRIGPRRLSVRKLNGQFPNYEAVVPRDHTNFTVVRTVELLGSVQRVLQFADEKSSRVKFHLENNALKISSSSPDQGESEETLPIHYAFPPVTLGLNGTYLVDFLKTIGGGGEVRISLKDANSAAVIMPENITAGYQQRYVVMPMRM
jgi:DNA polymerase-3 subunit beta